MRNRLNGRPFCQSMLCGIDPENSKDTLTTTGPRTPMLQDNGAGLGYREVQGMTENREEWFYCNLGPV